MVPIDSARVVSYSTSIDPLLSLSPFSEHLMPNFHDLELGGFKVIKGQSSQCQSKPMVGFLSDIL